MQCPTCQAPLTDDAPVYRVSLSWRQVANVVQHRCDRCVGRFAYNDAGRWRAPVACDGCGRQMVFDVSRAIPTIIACGPDCHRVVRSARLRDRRARQRGEERNCRWCSAPFRPKRTDSLVCSAVCRQRTYRQRRRAENRMP
jgi:hypothetical protein